MCGIAGWYLRPGTPGDRLKLRAMSAAIAHRGPDDEGEYIDESAGIALAHRRLSIIDLSPAGHQPMASPDGHVVLNFNGELYNFLDLRAELEAAGERFSSHCDTEVVAAALSRWGLRALDRFCGMFAFAAWFPSESKLLLARDPMGIKPLYYTSRGIGEGIAFASEIKAFLALDRFSPEIDPQSLRQYLEFGYVFDRDRTALAGVRKLPPGHVLEIVRGQIGQPTPYFVPQLSNRNSIDDLDGAADLLHDRMQEVVRQHLIADVPVGLLLSGGLDSSVLAALASRDSRVATISMGFADSSIDERANAKAVAQFLRSDHTEVLIRQRDIVEGLEEVVWYFDDLFADWGMVSTRLLYRSCRDRGMKVVLVGEGADELFAGYPVFEAARRTRGPMAWRLFQLYRRYAGRRYGGEFGRYNEIMRGHLRESSDGSLFDAVKLFESRDQLPNHHVMKVDRASMSVSVEARAPYLDRRIAEAAFGVRERHLIAGGSNKLILRRMAEKHNLLPSEVVNRPKFGASMPMSWMDDAPDFQRYAQSVVLSHDGWADRLGLRSAMTDFFLGKRRGYSFPHAISIFSNVAWRLLLLDLWSQQYLKPSST